ncbi:N-acetyltransferase [Ureibacillus thermophilus]|uniref:N-acetyltransferase n=2 Tax=Ureibacillus thermophilus TaxID=367743 RepID=A0A4P6UY84_9BACL|nr:N-acetyltransferase [Ureibacillus thermophilus]
MFLGCMTMNKEVIVKINRLMLESMTDDEIRTLIMNASDLELKNAYSEMLDSCMNDVVNRVWYSPWKVVLGSSKEQIGSIGFKGTPINRSVKIGYNIDSPYEGNGYATEDGKGLIEWAFAQQDVLFIEAETAADNAASMRILEKLEFKPNGTREEGLRFIKEKIK